MLTGVEIVLRCNPAASDLEHSTHLISDCLGPSPHLSLSDACSFGSVKLLDWIWESSSAAGSTVNSSRWSLCNYLQSDPHYYEYQFIKAMRVAAGQGDLKIVQWLFRHFSDCNLVPVTVVEDAAKNGHLTVLQFLLAHDAERHNRQEQCQAASSGEIGALSMCGCADQCGHTEMVVNWGQSDMKNAVQNGHFEVVRWLFEYTPRANHERGIEAIITLAMSVGEIALAMFLLPEDKCILDYTAECPCPEVVEWMLESEHLKLDADRAASAIVDLACGGHLDLMKRVAQLHSTNPTKNAHWLECWYDAMCAACMLGDLPMLQWLVQQPTGWEVCRCMKQNNAINYLLVMAAENGHVHLLPYIRKHGGCDRGYALRCAARNGQVESVRWLVEHISYAKHRSAANYAIAEAARYAQLEILQFFHNLGSTDTPGSKRKRTDGVSEWLSKMSSVMDPVAKRGQLEIVKWVHTNWTEDCTGKAFEFAAANGDLEMMQWLHSNTRARCTTNAIDCAAQKGHLHIVKWLCANHVGSCTVNTLEQALANGHLSVVTWIQTHFPQLALRQAFISRCPPNVFEVMLFMHEHYPHFITPAFTKKLEPFLRRSSMVEGKTYTLEWLHEHENC